MKLVVYELETSITQEIETDEIILLESIRPHLYKHNNPAGSLFLEIRNLSDDLLFTSESVTIQSIHDAAGEAYFHGVVEFPINASLAKNTKYNIILKSSGYSFSELSYIGWCNGYDLKVVENSYVPAGDLADALIMEFWERKKLRKGHN
jgi:hypothetical protein